MTSIQPELWVETPGEAVTFYKPHSAQPSFTGSATGTTSSRRLGLSNQGRPVPASTLSKDTSLAQAMKEFGFLSTLQLLGNRDGISFYAVQKPGGQFCFAVTDASVPAGAQRAASDVG
jgi:hypothetical protein